MIERQYKRTLGRDDGVTIKNYRFPAHIGGIVSAKKIEHAFHTAVARQGGWCARMTPNYSFFALATCTSLQDLGWEIIVGDIQRTVDVAIDQCDDIVMDQWSGHHSGHTTAWWVNKLAWDPE